MDGGNENIEPVTTELGLSLGFSDHNLPTRLNNDLGAGANAAASRIDMTIVAADPLAELVWSPHGPSLKCTECSFHEKKYTCLWSAESSHIVLSPQIIAAGKLAVDNKSPRYITSSRKMGESGLQEEMNIKGEISLQHCNEMKDLEQYMRGCASNEVAQDMEKELSELPDDSNRCVEQIDPLINQPVGGAIDISSENQKIIGIEELLAFEAHEPPEKNLVPPNGEKESKLEVKKSSCLCVSALENEEASAGNEFPVLIGETSKIVASEPAFGGEMSLEQDVKTIQKQTVLGQHSPTKRKILKHQRKGKEKALSDGYVKGGISDEEDDDSHESVESCSSIRLFSSGKRRCDFDHQLIVENKRIKKQSQSGPDSSAFVKQDSSFMNWISNMMKGYLNSKAEEKPFAHTVSHPGHDSLGTNLVRYDAKQDPGSKTVGFQSMFQSIYCPKKKIQGTTALDENGTSDADAAAVEATPIACHGENVNFHKMLFLQNERFKESTSGGLVGPTTELQRNSTDSSTENKNTFNLVGSAEKDGKSSSSSLGKRKVMNTENIDSDLHISNKTDPLRSLWIARFAPKASGPLLNQDNGHQFAGRVMECSTDSMKLLPFPENNADLSDDLKNVKARHQHEEPRLEHCVADTEVSIDFESVSFQNDPKCVNKLNLIVPSARLRNSEAMASLFARRLDALKHIMPAGVSEDGDSAVITCFFCGTKGHHLKHCTEITDAELEEIVKNFKPHTGVEESPCVCIRCFRVDHWAIACPSSSSIGQHWSSERNEGTPKLLTDHENQNAAVSCTVFDRSEIRTETNPSYVTGADKMRSSTNLNKKYEASCSRSNESRENPITPFCNFINEQVSDDPKGIFNAVKMLRLSRIDVLKWMNSRTSVPQLDGFFLRLRLGKWEKVLGGTGYYVACITGAHRQDSQRNPKSFISVNVGGIKCLVESQFISNHDFLEDELMAWWRATTKSGGKVPSKEDLKRKVKERMFFLED